MKGTFLKRVVSLIVVLALVFSVIIVTPTKVNAELSSDTSWYNSSKKVLF